MGPRYGFGRQFSPFSGRGLFSRHGRRAMVLAGALLLILPGAGGGGPAAQEGSSGDGGTEAGGELRPGGDSAVPAAGDEGDLSLDLPEVADPGNSAESSEPPPGGEAPSYRWVGRTGLLARRGSYRYRPRPQEFELGPLGPPFPGDRQLSEGDRAAAWGAYRTARQFLEGLEQGDVRRELILEEFRWTLGKRLDRPLGAQTVVQWRLGKPVLSAREDWEGPEAKGDGAAPQEEKTSPQEEKTSPQEGEAAPSPGIRLARLNVKLIGERGEALGEIFLRYSRRRWWVEDWQLDIQDLETAPEDREKPYRPR